MNRDPRFALSQELEAKQRSSTSSTPWPPRIPISSPTSSKARPILLELIAALDASILDDEILVDGAKAALNKLQARERAAENRIELKRRLLALPFLMLAKCAEAQAIRKGWPEDLSNTVGDEIEQAALTLHPAQAAAEGATRERLERIGGHGALIIDWLDAAPLDAVPLGQLADPIVAFLRALRL